MTQSKIDLFCRYCPERRAQVIWRRGEIRPLPLCWPCVNERLNGRKHKPARPTLEMIKNKKLFVKSSTGAIHIWTPGAGLMCHRHLETKPHNEPVSGRDICRNCGDALGAIWEPLARPEYERPPF